MANVNSYYLYQKYEKRGDQPWIPLDIYSIDGDGTELPVLRMKDDPNCHVDEIYRWVKTNDVICIDDTHVEYRTRTGDTYCSNANQYQDVYTEVSYDSGITWTIIETSTSLIAEDVYECGYRTSTATSYSCIDVDKYVTLYSIVSRDYGVTWTTASTISTEIAEINSLDCGYDPTPSPHDYSQDYFTTTALQDGNISWYYGGGSKSTEMYYSLDNGETWSSYYVWGNGINVSSGDTILWRGNNTNGRFSSSNKFKVSGNIMSLIYNDNFTGQTTISTAEGLSNLFRDCVELVRANDLVIPATTLANACCHDMFRGCTSLIAAPTELPATTLNGGAYQEMFSGCISLRIVPSVLPATTVKYNDYYGMFSGCTSLTTAPQISADTIYEASSNPLRAQQCFRYMFDGCTSLTTAPTELKPQYISNQAYAQMFRGCTSLTTSPIIYATTLYQTHGCEGMFSGCTNLAQITCLATAKYYDYDTTNWVDGVAASGTFIKAASMGDWSTGVNGIPSGWTVNDYTN